MSLCNSVSLPHMSRLTQICVAQCKWTFRLDLNVAAVSAATASMKVGVRGSAQDSKAKRACSNTSYLYHHLHHTEAQQSASEVRCLLVIASLI